MRGARIIATIDMVVAIFWITTGIVTISVINGYFGLTYSGDSPIPYNEDSIPKFLSATKKPVDWALLVVLNVIAAVFIMVQICFLLFAYLLALAIEKRSYEKLNRWIAIASVFFIIEVSALSLLIYGVVHSYGAYALGFCVYPISKLTYEAISIAVVRFYRYEVPKRRSLSHAPSMNTVVEHL